ncbi:MAG: oligosaccharide flippase family protein [Bacteroidota bacterium]
MSIIAKVRGLIDRGHERTVRAKKNILMAILFKGLGMLIGFAYFPLSLAYLSPAKFGIFLTLTSMIDWFGELDIGIGNGLRNRLGEAIADGDEESAKGYISTAYFVLGSIFSGITVVFLGLSFFMPWADWLQADPNLNREIAFLAMLMFGAFAINFVASLVYEVFYALQKVAMVDLFSFIGKVLFLIVIISLVCFTEESLILFGGAKTFTFALVPVVVGIYYFNRDFKHLRPSFGKVKRIYFDALFSLGVQFFLIKFCMIIIHQTNNILIARFVSLEGVTQYEAAYKYLSIFIMLFVILSNQLWAASIEAYRKGDMAWMKKTVRSTLRIWMGTIIVCLLMILVSPFVFKVWLQGKIQIPLLLTIAVAASISITTWVNMFNLVLNGTGKIRLQMYAWIAASLLNIPLSIFMAVTLNLGTIGIVLGTLCSMVPLAILSPIQVRKILHRTDKGIWTR